MHSGYTASDDPQTPQHFVAEGIPRNHPALSASTYQAREGEASSGRLAHVEVEPVPYLDESAG